MYFLRINGSASVNAFFKRIHLLVQTVVFIKFQLAYSTMNKRITEREREREREKGEGEGGEKNTLVYQVIQVIFAEWKKRKREKLGGKLKYGTLSSQ